MIQITKTSKSEIGIFGKKEWPKANIEHYGKEVDYKETEFIYKATNKGEIVGIITGKHEAGIVYINNIIVACDKRGQGIGGRLMKKAEDFGKKFKAHKMHLVTGKGWEAEKFYEALGFKQICLLPNHHFHKDFVLFEKFI